MDNTNDEERRENSENDGGCPGGVLDLDGIERKARAATPGPWTASQAASAGLRPNQPAGSAQVRCDASTERVPSGCLIPFFILHETDAQHIAAVNPQVTLALIAVARAAKAVRDVRRQGLRGDYPQDLHDDLARALDEAGL